MYRTHPRFLALTVLTLMAACGPGDGPEPEDALTSPGQDASPPAAQAPMDPPSATVTIGLDANGTPTVNQDPVVLQRRFGPVMAWAGDPSVEGRTWIVAFAAGTPFQNGRTVFSNAPQGAVRAPISRTTELGDYKYWVFVSNPDSTWSTLDPRLRIREDPGANCDTCAVNVRD